MLFYDGIFLFFLACTVGVCIAARTAAWRVPVLLVASYVFYAAWDWRFLFLIFGATAVNYLAARGMPGAPAGRRRALLVLSLAASLGTLAVFKYLDFGIGSLNALLGTDMPLARLTLPVGISFFTFQAMSYTIDVYRGRLGAHGSFAEFALFVSFFPQLVAGPIIRAADFLPQIPRALAHIPNRLVQAVPLFVLGLFKKVVLADQLAGIVEPAYGAPVFYGAADLALATVAFTGQIYCDFSGYTDMALALCILFGFEFPLNFRSPYLARGPQDFWRRWHISLSSWLRDYLFISLGGSRRGRARTYLALALTMLLGGLWHGAAWTFVLWGAYHGALLISERFLKEILPATLLRLLAPLGTAFFLLATVLGWTIFRADSLPSLGVMLTRIARAAPSGGFALPSESYPIVAAAAVFLFFEHVLGERNRASDWSERHPYTIFAVTGVLLLAAVVLRPLHSEPFIYFQF
ncbi:MAG: MBOAT family protein [Deltaproteobacteria bacterium]|nr:MBOAT family protein [Deltaproteobacteria bacterium]MBW2414925.1 MBOAT family protein [Deltaproteobacteria bacterium]